MLTRRALPAWMVATVGGLAALTPLSAYAQSCPVESGASGVLNAYYPGSSSVSAGSSSISLGSRTGASTNIAAGDLLIAVDGAQHSCPLPCRSPFSIGIFLNGLK